MQFDISRKEAEALIDLLEEKERPYPLDQLADDLREMFGMVPGKSKDDLKPSQSIGCTVQPSVTPSPDSV